MTEAEVSSLELRSSAPRRWAASDYRTLPPWILLIAAYAMSRVVTAVVVAGVYWFASSRGLDFPSFLRDPGPIGFLESWDGLYYRQIALEGYPSVLPTDDLGRVEKNPWAFLPLFPLIVRAVIVITGLDFALAGSLVASVFGCGATIVLYRMLVQRLGAAGAMWPALLFCFGPMSFVLQVAYAESVFLFFMFAALAAMGARRYLLMAVLGTAASFAHPGALALAAALGIAFLLRLRGDFPRSQRWRAIVAGVAITAAGFAWPLVAAVVTGRESAYFLTEMAWWRDYVGDVQFVPFTPWFLLATHFFGAAGIGLVVAAIIGCAVLLIVRRRRVSTEIMIFSAGYVAYLVAVFLPQQSIFRMLLPLAPLLGDPALTSTARRRRVLLTIGICSQPAAVFLLWFIWPP